MKKNEKKPVLQVGDVETVEFIRNEKKPGKPICRLSNGMVGFIHGTYNGNVLPRSVWSVSVVAMYDKHVYVMPLDKIKTAQQSLKEIDSAALVFKAEKHERKHRPRVKYTNQ